MSNLVNVMYSMIGVISTVILSFIFYRNRRFVDEYHKRHVYFALLVAGAATFSFVDSMWGMVASGYLLNFRWLPFFSTMFYLFGTLAALAWLVFIAQFTGLADRLGHRTLFSGLSLVPLTIVIFILIVNWSNGILFSVSETGEYIRGVDGCSVFVYLLQFVYFFAAIVISVYAYSKRSDPKIDGSPAVILFAVIPVAAGVLQLYNPDLPYYTIGFMFGCFVVFFFDVMSDREAILLKEGESRNNSIIQALAAEYTCVFLIDVNSESVEVFRVSNSILKAVPMLADPSKTRYTTVYDTFIDAAVSEDSRDEMRSFGRCENLKAALLGRQTVSRQFLYSMNGNQRFFEAKWVRIGAVDEPLTKVVIGFADVDEQVSRRLHDEEIIENQKKKIKTVLDRAEQAKRAGQTDKLTGLLIKSSGYSLIRDYVNMKDDDESYALMFVDMDRFKTINDNFGHLSGDDVLAAVGRIIRRKCRPDDIKLRFGGDEFLILLKNISSQDVAAAKAESIRKEFMKISDEKGFKVTCSIGICITDSKKYEEAIKKADTALYEVKNTTRDSVFICADDDDSVYVG